MAEGWVRHLHADRIDVQSAGIETHGLNPLAVEAMKRYNVDISRQKSKLVSELTHIQFDLVITVCDHAHEHCPLLPGSIKVIHQGFDDPPRLAKNTACKKKQLTFYLDVCREIREFAKTL